MMLLSRLKPRTREPASTAVRQIGVTGQDNTIAAAAMPNNADKMYQRLFTERPFEQRRRSHSEPGPDFVARYQGRRFALRVRTGNRITPKRCNSKKHSAHARTSARAV